MKKETCRLCKGRDLVMFLDLGFHPHSDNFRKDPDLPEIQYPLRLVKCQNCQFVQLDYVVSPEVLYDEDYLYESSITKTADKHWTEFIDYAITATQIYSGKVLDIGSNDGTLLSKFKERGFQVQGVDPCTDIAKIAINRGIPTWVELFGSTKRNEKFDIITGSNVFAHIDDLDKVMTDVNELLNENGVFIFESPYLGDFISNLEYDTVYHQHLSYLAVKPLVKFLVKHNMEIFDIEFTDIHGGCFRCYIARKGEREVRNVVYKTMNNENFSLDVLQDFALKVEQNRVKLVDIVLNFKKKGRKIVGISTPAKGMTLLNYTGVGKFLDFTTDISKLKQGRYTPGSHLLIKSDKDLQGDEVGLLLAWNFQEEIIRNVPQIKTWIIPNPTPYVINRFNN
jgi:SAM-dependent methyltransferase